MRTDRPALLPTVAVAATILCVAAATRGQEPAAPDSPKLSPADSLAKMRVADDLALDLILAEPVIEQPVFLNFDERGRMWVVEYRQYPRPAGLQEVSRDRFWRVVYDRTIPPPPYAPDSPFRGRDRISIHQDADGDGQYESHKVFLDALNITTAVERGRGGVWVLSPPQLLFYGDADNNDIPDSDPVVHLTGFGLEDTHSVTNSLRWGPDGWLYASQGSTVSAEVRRPGIEGPDDPPIARTIGQLIWRYHPESRRFEVFAEGGGNAFGVELDDAARLFSGHNGGDTRGFHYVQGGYHQKTFQKHGELSNPYAFGYFPPMSHDRVPRFTHNFVIYGDEALPDRYDGKLLGIEPLQGRVVMSQMRPIGATFGTKDEGHPLVSDDPWFRPVDIKVGPDGALYIADFHERLIGHQSHFGGEISPETGRIWRLRAKDSAAGARPDGSRGSFDMAKSSTADLIALLSHSNRWDRQTALRLLADRRDPAAIDPLQQLIRDRADQSALEALWALNLSGGFDESAVADLHLLDHPNPNVRLWAVRLLGDAARITSPTADRLASLAAAEPIAEVRGQLASTARRLPADPAIQIITALLAHNQDAADPYVPLLIWWAIESKCGPDDRPALLAMLRDPDLWQHKLMGEAIASRLMRRFAASATQRDLLTCADLLELAPDPASRSALMTGFERAFEGRSVPPLPDRLLAALENAGGLSLPLRVRRGGEQAVTEALSRLVDPSAPAAERADLALALGQTRAAGAEGLLLQLAVADDQPAPLRRAALAALVNYDGPTIGRHVTDALPRMDADTRLTALTLLTARPGSARALLDALESNRIDRDAIPIETVDALRLLTDESVARSVRNLWPQPRAVATTAELAAEIDRIKSAVNQGGADPYAGKLLYLARCGACHRLFESGGDIGPDLTAYQRDDLDALLSNIVAPSAELREGYASFVVRTNDGRVLSGFLADESPDRLVIRGLDGADQPVNRGDVAEMTPLGRSLMPDGLLSGLDDGQLRDLLAYLRSGQPLNE